MVSTLRHLSRSCRRVLTNAKADRYLHTRIDHLGGARDPDLTSDDVVVLCLARNGAEWIAEFVHHYLEQGAKHIVFLDNDSTDDTVRIALELSKRVSVFKTRLPFCDYNLRLKQYLLRRFAHSSWAALVDVDEFLTMPFEEEASLPEVVRYCNARGFTAVAANLLDMFSRHQHVGKPEPAGAFARNRDWYYDLGDVAYENYNLRNIMANTEIRVARGGIRARLFDTPHVTLTKHPLLAGFTSPTLLDSHFVHTRRLADFTGVLLHHKFAGDFPSRVLESASAREHCSGPQHFDECRHYGEVVQSHPDMPFRGPESEPWTGTERLIDAGFVTVSTDFAEQFRPREIETTLPQ